MYELDCPLSENQPFDKWKEKTTPSIYLVMSTINARTLALINSLSTGRVSPKFHVTFDLSITTTNGIDVNIFPPSYWQAMCGFIKGKRSMFVHYEQYDPSSTSIYSSDKGCTTRENVPEPEEHSAPPQVKEYDT